MNTETNTTGDRLSTAIRVVVLLAVLTLAAVALLFVFDVLPLSLLKEATVRILLGAAIVAIAGVACVLLTRPGPR